MVLTLQAKTQVRQEFEGFTLELVKTLDASILEEYGDQDSATIIAALPSYNGLDQVKKFVGSFVREYADVEYHAPWKWSEEKEVHYAFIMVIDLLIIAIYHENSNQVYVHYNLIITENGKNND
jgi:hypothetical protein